MTRCVVSTCCETGTHFSRILMHGMGDSPFITQIVCWSVVLGCEVWLLRTLLSMARNLAE